MSTWFTGAKSALAALAALGLVFYRLANRPIDDALLVVAAMNNHTNKIAQWVRKGANVNVYTTKGDHATPLMAACSYGRLEAAALLLELGSDPGVRDLRGRTALSFAEQNGHADVANLLLAEVSRPRRTGAGGPLSR